MVKLTVLNKIKLKKIFIFGVISFLFFLFFFFCVYGIYPLNILMILLKNYIFLFENDTNFKTSNIKFNYTRFDIQRKRSRRSKSSLYNNNNYIKVDASDEIFKEFLKNNEILDENKNKKRIRISLEELLQKDQQKDQNQDLEQETLKSFLYKLILIDLIIAILNYIFTTDTSIESSYDDFRIESSHDDFRIESSYDDFPFEFEITFINDSDTDNLNSLYDLDDQDSDDLNNLD